MRLATAIALVLLVASIGSAQAPTATAAQANPLAPGNATNGKALFTAHQCWACHGYNGETGQRPFVGNWGNLATEEGFIRFLRGRANIAPENKSTAMPNFAESTMPDAQAKDIYAYIRTFKSTAPALKDIPTLNAIIEAASKPAQK